MGERLRVRELEGVIGKLSAAKGNQHELDAALDDIEEAFAERVPVEERVTAMPFARLSTTSTRKAVAIRRSEIPLMVDPTGAPGISALEPAASRGPFLTEVGERIWIDTFRFLTQTTILNVPKPVAIFKAFGFVTPGQPIVLAAGSFWIATSRLVPGRPDNEFAGFKIRGGTIRLSGSVTASPGAVAVTGNWNAEVELTLDPPTASPTPAEVNLPELSGLCSARLDSGASVSRRAGFLFTERHLTSRVIKPRHSSTTPHAPSSFQPTRRRPNSISAAWSRRCSRSGTPERSSPPAGPCPLSSPRPINSVRRTVPGFSGWGSIRG